MYKLWLCASSRAVLSCQSCEVDLSPIFYLIFFRFQLFQAKMCTSGTVVCHAVESRTHVFSRSIDCYPTNTWLRQLLCCMVTNLKATCWIGSFFSCFLTFLIFFGTWGENVLRSQDSWFGLGFRVRVQNMASVKKVDLFLTVIKILLFFDWNFWWVKSLRMVFQQHYSSTIVVNGCSMNHCTTPQQPHMVYIPA